MIWSWLVVNWSWVNNRLVNNWGYVWGWLVYNWGMVWSWLVVYWSWVVWSSVMERSMMESMEWSMNWGMSWGMDCSTILLLGIWVVYVLWCGMRLTGDNRMISSMRPMDSMANGWSVSMFDDLMATLVGQSYCQKG